MVAFMWSMRDGHYMHIKWMSHGHGMAVTWCRDVTCIESYDQLMRPGWSQTHVLVTWTSTCCSINIMQGRAMQVLNKLDNFCWHCQCGHMDTTCELISCYVEIICDDQGEMSHMLKIFNFKICTISANLQMLQFDANPIRIGYLVTELWSIY